MAVASLARRIVLAGGTGYPGCRLIPLLIERGHVVRSLALAPARYGHCPSGKAAIGIPLNSASSPAEGKHRTLGGVER